MARADLQLAGFEQLLLKMKRLTQTAEGAAARRAIRAASRIVVVGARQRVRKDTGLLKKSLGVKIKTYRYSRTTVGLVGPRRGFKIQLAGIRQSLRTREYLKARYKNPVRYAHLIERGTRHFPAKPFLRPALDSNKSAIQQAMSTAIRKELGLG